MQDESTDELQSKLESAIKEKSFFLVLDDLWQSDTWTNLLRIPLCAAATGIILVTSRLDTIAVEIGVDHTHRVNLMSVDVGWELLLKSMDIVDEKGVQNLRDIGVDIVRKCGCLPLAIKVVAKVLACRDQTENEWKKILRKDAWSMSKLPSEITTALYLSYEELPHNLKQCFIYCAMYPEDTVLKRDDIIRTWVAEGFIDEQDGQLLEDTAEEYYYELIHRNLLHPDYLYADLRFCRVHDLLWQLACFLSREECFVGDPESIGVNVMSKFRRISVSGSTVRDVVVLPSMDKEKYKVRTWRIPYKPLRVDNAIFGIFPYIRVLKLAGSLIKSVPPCIGFLIHLRLLDLDGTGISCLPESIRSLVNLQTLDLQRCSALYSLPTGVTLLSNLRHLILRDTPINQVPKGIGRLSFLNEIGGFPVGGGWVSNTRVQDGWNLEELGSLLQLRSLGMMKLERAGRCSKGSLLINKVHLKRLSLHCSGRTDEPYSEKDVINIEKTFEELIPSHNLEVLDIIQFFGQRYPTWLGSFTHLPSLKYLVLKDCGSCVHLPTIGQLPNLKYLRIKGATAVTKIGPEFVGCGVANPRSAEAVAFPKLETLFIGDMPNWEEWTLVEEESGAASKEGRDEGIAAKQKERAEPPRMQMLPRLMKLLLWNCPKLRALPQQLGQDATSLKILILKNLNSIKVVESLPFLYEVSTVACEGLERVSNIPQVRRMKVSLCPNLRHVEGLESLHQLFLTEDMQGVSSQWLPGLQEQHRKLHGEDMDVYNWTL
ncbi:unnamed protein product [Urochloa humidicola]